MIAEIDIWRTAALLVKRHGADARIAAAQRSDERVAAGDIESYAVWKRMLAAVAELTRMTPAEGERVN